MAFCVQPSFANVSLAYVVLLMHRGLGEESSVATKVHPVIISAHNDSRNNCVHNVVSRDSAASGHPHLYRGQPLSLNTTQLFH